MIKELKENWFAYVIVGFMTFAFFSILVTDIKCTYFDGNETGFIGCNVNN